MQRVELQPQRIICCKLIDRLPDLAVLRVKNEAPGLRFVLMYTFAASGAGDSLPRLAIAFSTMPFLSPSFAARSNRIVPAEAPGP